MPADYGVALVGFIGAIIGAAASFAGQWWLRHLSDQKETQALASALSAEIEGYVSLMERRNHVTGVREMAIRARQGHAIDLGSLMTSKEIDSEPFPVMHAHLDRIGLLGRYAGRLLQFYWLIYGVRMTIIANCEGKHAGWTPEQIASLIDRECDVWDEAMAKGRTLCRELNRIAMPSSLLSKLSKRSICG
ncbi:hypothetical protein SI859A1_02495 [Aurantimonas manganoxydans SI85-9A1]|uniref:Uncharacterized protein n=1 Tax=Aurantimonas manganoxydans (strain ATCC BAA-1229 / DSM 21871 / SI85-9A1) TaxID=287752 RepID=Q1YLQ2_AURMS|nr:hypothetical protein [Aurantimonas manganoxydans]EAS51679.1 hypothetical protein SI859A1_02495 [Aurantimonas manganoxydans SI85-9A1]